MGSCCQTSTKGQFQVLSDRQKADNLQKLSEWQAQDPTLRTVLNQVLLDRLCCVGALYACVCCDNWPVCLFDWCQTAVNSAN